jgi:4-diphosphocytidyl-2-C-methyl-D-erythritol kinase
MMQPAVTERAPAKINLALHVLGRRGDGYHDLDSIVAFADMGDVLTLSLAEVTTLTCSGPFAGPLELEQDNLVLRAHRALAAQCKLGPVTFHLEKNLPIASGLGGGSADAAAALRGLMRLFDIHPPPERLAALALQLGADVPVCLHGQPCRMGGIGEKLEPARVPASAIVLVNPGKATSTPAVFRELGLAQGGTLSAAIDPSSHIASWRNDLTAPAIRLVPDIGDVISALNAQPEITCARMSGSGATCFGLADNLQAAQNAAQNIAASHPYWWVKACLLT